MIMLFGNYIKLYPKMSLKRIYKGISTVFMDNGRKQTDKNRITRRV